MYIVPEHSIRITLIETFLSDHTYRLFIRLSGYLVHAYIV
jgi:hypothetical protein